MRLIADDLTGAADAAVAFVGTRDPVRISLAGPLRAAGVLALDTGTRDRGEEEAAAALRAALSHVAPGDELVVKIDSRLRGHVARTVATLRDALPERDVVVAPAFPAVGRFQTAAAIAAALAPLEIRPGETPGVRAGEAPAPVAVFAARTDAELDALVAARAGLPTAWVGTGGITRALARRESGLPPAAPRLRGPFLAVIGSTADVARAQVAALAAHGAVVAGPADDLAARENLIVTSPDHPALAEAAARASLLLLSGGATARAVLQRCGVTELDVVAELEPGVVALRAAQLDAAIVTKSGSFGDAGTWVRILGR